MKKSASQKQLKAGAAKIDITPVPGTIINGDFVPHYAVYFHDPLFSKALVLQNDDVTLVFVVVDICVMPKDFVDEVKDALTGVTHLSKEHILISSTHTHAAGSVADVHLTGPDVLYRAKLPGLIVQSVIKALNNLKPAKIAFGKAAAPEHVLSRRYQMKPDYEPFNPLHWDGDAIKTNPFGVESYIIQSDTPVDPELSFLAVKDLNDEWISILGNYSLHYVGDWPNGTISADYFGYFAATLQNLLHADEGFVGIMSNGTSGDINIWEFLHPERYPTEPFAKSELIGSELATKVVKALEGLEWESTPVLKVVYEELSLKVNKPTEEEITTATEKVLASNYEHIVPDEEGLRSLYAREQLLLSQYPAQLSAPLQAFRIGEGIIGALPGEFFAQTGLALKEKVERDNYFTISLANANVGYVPPFFEKQKGGYETWRCRYSCLEDEAEEICKKSLLTLIQRLQ